MLFNLWGINTIDLILVALVLADVGRFIAFLVVDLNITYTVLLNLRSCFPMHNAKKPTHATYFGSRLIGSINMPVIPLAAYHLNCPVDN